MGIAFLLSLLGLSIQSYAAYFYGSLENKINIILVLLVCCAFVCLFYARKLILKSVFYSFGHSLVISIGCWFFMLGFKLLAHPVASIFVVLFGFLLMSTIFITSKKSLDTIIGALGGIVGS